MKPALIVAVTLTLCVYFSPRCAAQERPSRAANKSSSKNQEGRPPTAQIPYQIQNQWIQTEAPSRAAETPHWYKTPEGLLVVVGVITFLVIGWQSWETRRAANASALAAQASQGQIRLMEIPYQPWLDVDEWAVKIALDSLLTLTVEYRVANPTNFPLTIKQGQITVSIIGGGVLGTFENYILGPLKSRVEGMRILVSKDEMRAFNEDKIFLPVESTFIIFGPLKEDITQKFQGTIICGKHRGAGFIPTVPMATNTENDQRPN